MTDKQITDTRPEDEEISHSGLEGALAPLIEALAVRRPMALTGIFIIAVFYFLYFAAPVLMPITFALLLNMLLMPGVRLLVRCHLPTPLAAAIVLSSAVFLLLGTIYLLARPAQEWLQKAPDSFYKVEQKLRTITEPIENIEKATAKIEQATKSGNQSTETQEITLVRPSLTDILLSGTPQVLATAGVVTILLFFLLSSGDTFLRKLVAVIPTLEDKKRAVEIVRNIQGDISFYLLAITLVNLGLGISVAAVLAFLGVSNPLLWGAMVAILNFAPYVGAAVNLVVLTTVGMLSFDSLSQALLVPGIFAVLSVLASNVILPLALGQRLLLSPVAIFVAIMVWGWMWGVIGALLAVPLLASFKIVCERVESLQPIAEFLTP